MTVMTEETIITTTEEDREATIVTNTIIIEIEIEKIIWVTKRRIQTKNSSKRTDLVKQVDMEAVDPRREIITGIEGMEETTTITNSKMKKKKKKSLSTKPSMIKQ